MLHEPGHHPKHPSLCTPAPPTNLFTFQSGGHKRTSAVSGGGEVTATFLYWWGCLWIFEGPFNLAWDEIRKQQPLCVAFILLQHNVILRLKALYYSCVNPPPLWQNVSITQRSISHTHNNALFHIVMLLSAPPPAFLSSFHLCTSDDILLAPAVRRCILKDYPTNSSFSRWLPECEHACAFLCIINSFLLEAMRRNK